MKTTTMKPDWLFTVILPSEWKKPLYNLAIDKGVKVADLIRQAVEEYLERRGRDNELILFSAPKT
jgi:predicted DNA-binding protein